MSLRQTPSGAHLLGQRRGQVLSLVKTGLRPIQEDRFSLLPEEIKALDTIIAFDLCEWVALNIDLRNVG
jgi:hypothetical protein